MDDFMSMPFDELEDHMDNIHRQHGQLHARLHGEIFDMQHQMAIRHHEMFQQAQNMFQRSLGMMMEEDDMMNFPPTFMHPFHQLHQSMLAPFPTIRDRLPHPHMVPRSPHSHPNLSYESMLALDSNVVKKGVSQHDLAKLKRRRFAPRDPCKQCGICQDNFNSGMKIISLPCAHSFCEDELLKWFAENKTCPTCRFVVENI